MVSRKRASIQNAATALVSQLIMMVGQFATQTIFVKTLGAQYLGANGLFSNLIQFLSFAELGIGAAFSYALYKPLADHNQAATTAIMDLFRKVYNTIGLVILAAGSVLTFFVPWFVAKGSSIDHIRWYFFLYLLSTVVSYFFTYNRSLLIADQKSYVDATNQLIWSTLKYVFQIGFLLLFHSYFGYLIVLIATNILSNVFITMRSRHFYPYLKEKSDVEIDPSIVNNIKKNVVGTVSSKIGSIVVTGTDNILISKFIGLAVVGLYSNYALILTSITRLLTQVFAAVIASFGNLGATEGNNKDKQVDLFNQFTFYNAFSVFFIGLVSFAAFPPFIKLWVGSHYQLAESTVWFIVINFVFGQFRPALNMINAYGLFWGYRVKSIVEAVVNFGLSLLLVKFTSLGINGVLLGTIIGNILVNSWWDPWILFSGAYQRSMLGFYAKYWIYMAAFGALLVIESFIIKLVAINPVGLLPVMGYMIVVALIVGIVLLGVFAKTRGEREMFRLLKNIVHR